MTTVLGVVAIFLLHGEFFIWIIPENGKRVEKYADKYSTEKGNPNTVNFNPVKTPTLKLEVKLKEKVSAGVFEWSVSN